MFIKNIFLQKFETHCIYFTGTRAPSQFICKETQSYISSLAKPTTNTRTSNAYTKRTSLCAAFAKLVTMIYKFSQLYILGRIDFITPFRVPTHAHAHFLFLI